MSSLGERVVMSYLSPLVNNSLVNNSLVTYNPLSPNSSGVHDRTTPRCVVADKNRKAGCNFAVGFDGNTLIVQRFPSSSYSSNS